METLLPKLLQAEALQLQHVPTCHQCGPGPHTVSCCCCQVAAVVSESATPQTVAHLAPLSLGFSRYESWSGLPFPSPMQACLLSHFSCVQLCATLRTVAPQTPLIMGLSRQEDWSGLPLPSPDTICRKTENLDDSAVKIWECKP